MPVEHDGIIEIRDLNLSRAIAVIHQQFPAANILEPGRVLGGVLAWVVAFHPQRQLLPGLAGGFDRRLQQFCVELSRLWFECGPAPADVEDLGGNPRRPALVGFGWVAEGLPADPRIREEFGGLLGLDHDRRIRSSGQSPDAGDEGQRPSCRPGSREGFTEAAAWSRVAREEIRTLRFRRLLTHDDGCRWKRRNTQGIRSESDAE